MDGRTCDRSAKLTSDHIQIRKKNAAKGTNTFCVLEILPRESTHLNLWASSRTIHSACVYCASTSNKRPSDAQQRPQTLAIHLKRDSQASKAEAYVGWTGMASSSSLAHFNADARENAFETIEIDPQYAQGLGFAEGDIVRLLLLKTKSVSSRLPQVEIGLLYDLPFASSVGTEPLTADDWEIIVSLLYWFHRNTYRSLSRKSMLLMSSQLCCPRFASQKSVKKLMCGYWDAQEFVSLLVGSIILIHVFSWSTSPVSLAPSTKGNAALLTTDSEVSIAPKTHARQKAIGGAPSSISQDGTAKKDPAKASLPATVLRVLPTRLIARFSPSSTCYNRPETLAYIHPYMFSNLAQSRYPMKEDMKDVFLKFSYRLLDPPQNPLDPPRNDNANAETQEPAAQVLHPGGKSEPPAAEKTSSNVSTEIFMLVGWSDKVLESHVYFPYGLEGVSDWHWIQ